MATATKNLDGFVHDTPAKLGGEELGQGGLDTDGVAAGHLRALTVVP